MSDFELGCWLVLIGIAGALVIIFPIWIEIGEYRFRRDIAKIQRDAASNGGA